MVYRFRPPTDIEYSSIRIAKRTGDVLREATDEDLPPDARSFADPFHKDGDLYAFRLVDANGTVVHESEFSEASRRPDRTFRLEDLFHPEELAACPIPDGVLVAVVHQNMDPNGWWESTRTWLVRTSDGTITLSDDLFWPRGQEPFDYSQAGEHDLYLMPTQMYSFLSYLSLKIEKPFYEYPEELPKGYSITELIEYLASALGRFNSEQPVTSLGFRFHKGLNPPNTPTSVPQDSRQIIVKLASIEAQEAMVVKWIELDVEYSDGGADVNLNKYDRYSSMLSDLKGDVIEEMARHKNRFLPKGFFLGSQPTLVHPWHTLQLGLNDTPFLHYRAGLTL